MPIEAVNDFVIRFANVNGSGSASANLLFARSILRMGVPIAPRNIFPSNIQGLPTWYEVRVSEEGWLGARGGADVLVAMNAQTFAQDVAALEPGGYLFYDSTRPLPPSAIRNDIVALGMPLTAICAAQYSEPRQRQLYRNIVYVGALAALLDIDLGVMETLAAERFKGKDKLIEANQRALRIGHDEAMARFACPIGVRVRRSDAVGDRILVEGNFAAALGAVYGGATVCSWYPITPSTSVAEAFERLCSRHRVDASGKKNYAIVQAEDEIAAIGMAVGAGWNGARAFTATSGPGISLMQEFFGLAYFAEIPVVVFDVQRGGPSTGMPTRTQQSDLLSCAFASHGDTKHALLIPDGPNEAFEFGADAFDLAERLQTPVFVMLDLDIGMNSHLSAPFKWDDARTYDRGKVLSFDDLEKAPNSAVTTTSTATEFPIERFPAAIRRAAPISPAAPAAIASRAIPRKGCPISTTWSGWSTSSRPRAACCRARFSGGRRSRPGSAFSTTDRLLRRWTRPSRCWSATASLSTPCASARFRSPMRCWISSTTMIRSSSSSRIATRRCAR